MTQSLQRFLALSRWSSLSTGSGYHPRMAACGLYHAATSECASAILLPDTRPAQGGGSTDRLQRARAEWYGAKQGAAAQVSGSGMDAAAISPHFQQYLRYA